MATAGEEVTIPAERSRLKVEPRVYPIEEVATILAVGQPQVRALIRSGELPAIRIGGRGVRRIERTRLEEWIEEAHVRTGMWIASNALGSANDRG